ncbi:MAG: hypothetical protein R3C18_11585 [Planctomycetaceae bacterium]
MRFRPTAGDGEYGLAPPVALSLLKRHPAKSSLAMKRRSCGWNWDFLLEVIGFKTLSVR